MHIEMTQQEIALLARLLSARVDSIHPLHDGGLATRRGAEADEELATLLPLKERLEFALVGSRPHQPIPHNIIYSDSYESTL